MYALMPFKRERTLGRLRRDTEDIFERFFGGFALPELKAEVDFDPKFDIKETEEGFEVLADVPGLKPEEIEVTLQDGVLTIQGEKKSEREEKQEKYHLVERSYGRFYRSFRLPEDIDCEKLSATQKDGVLKITLPRGPEAKPKEIEVKAG